MSWRDEFRMVCARLAFDTGKVSLSAEVTPADVEVTIDYEPGYCYSEYTAADQRFDLTVEIKSQGLRRNYAGEDLQVFLASLLSSEE